MHCTASWDLTPLHNIIHNVHLSRYKGTKDLIQIHKTLQTSKEDNAHHYTFMCFVVYSIYFEQCRGGKSLFSVESSRKRGEKASGGTAGPRHWPGAPHHSETPPLWKFSPDLCVCVYSVHSCRCSRWSCRACASSANWHLNHRRRWVSVVRELLSDGA